MASISSPGVRGTGCRHKQDGKGTLRMTHRQQRMSQLGRLGTDTVTTGPDAVMSETLFAIDPGPHTGIAVKIDGNYHTATITSPPELWDMLNQFRPGIVAYEDFIGSGPRDININGTLQLVGSIVGICHVLGLKSIRNQPQARRAFIQEARRLLSGVQPTPHEIDALAHLLLLEYQIKEGKA